MLLRSFFLRHTRRLPGAGGIGRFKDGPLATLDDGPALLAVRWSEVADYENGAVPPGCAANGDHRVYIWASRHDAAWRATHPDAWPMLVVTWHQMVARGCAGPPNTFQMIIAQRPELGASGRNLALVEYRHETCNWSAPIMGSDVVGARSGVLVRGAVADGGGVPQPVAQAIEIFGAAGRLEDHIDDIPNPESEGFSADPSMPMAYCARSNVEDAMGAPVPGVFVFQFGLDGLIERNGAAGDPDLDGIPSAIDNCPARYNPRQNDLGGEPSGDACDPDQDGDEVNNVDAQGELFDNCPRVSNAAQTDADNDGRGDLCDADRDGDGWPNTFQTGAGQSSGIPADNCPDIANENQYDFDKNGFGDVCETSGLTLEQAVAIVVAAQSDLDFLIFQWPNSSEVKQLAGGVFEQSTIKWDEVHAVVIEVVEAWQASKMKYFSEYLKWHEEERLYRLEKSK